MVNESIIFAFQFVAGTAMREAVPECFFHPAFQYGGCAVPEDWKLQHDNVGFQQALLLCVNINFKVGIKGIVFTISVSGRYCPIVSRIVLLATEVARSV